MSDNLAKIHTRYLLRYFLTYGAEFFLRSCQLCEYSRTSQHFMELKGLLPCSQEPYTGPYPKPDRSSPYYPTLSKIYFNIVLPPTSWSSLWSLSFSLSPYMHSFTYQDSVYLFVIYLRTLFCNSGCVMLSGGMIVTVYRKACGRKQPWLGLKYYPSTSLEGQRRTSIPQLW
jgi:hypothetical protein